MKYLVAMFSMGCITWLDITALKAGIDGVLMITCVGVVGGIGTVFFVKSGDRAKFMAKVIGRKVAAALIVLAPFALASCAQVKSAVKEVVENLPPVEICLKHETYGTVCVIVGKEVYVKADLDPATLEEVKAWALERVGR